MFRLVALLCACSSIGLLALQVEAVQEHQVDGSQGKKPSSHRVSKQQVEVSKEYYEDRRLQRLYLKVFTRLGAMKALKPKGKSSDSAANISDSAASPPKSEGRYVLSEGRFVVSTNDSSLADRKPSKPKKEKETDWFIVGTANVNSVTAHADVFFHAVESQEDTAKKIVNYISTPQGQSYLRWHVFARATDSKEADQLLVAVRKEYDEMVSYRKALMQRYKAKTIRRC